LKSASLDRNENAVIAKVRDVAGLFKMRLSFLVVVSAFLGYLVGAETISWNQLLILGTGGFLLTGGSNGMNQVLEREWDKLMLRTMNRPIPGNRMGVSEALIISMVATTAGILLLWFGLNTASGVLGLCAFFMYVFLYTPLKRVTSLSVFVGAFPGAIPPMLGYVAATNHYGLEAGLLFAMQFMWQFPHFWSIAWVAYDDYVRGGYQMLPFNEGRTKRTAFQVLLYSFFLLPVSLLPWALPLSSPLVGNLAMAVAVVCGSVMIWYAWKLWRSCEIRDARKLMFASFFYLPIVQLFYVLDKL
jgi:protoheme IX farnesyltransferase